MSLVAMSTLAGCGSKPSNEHESTETASPDIGVTRIPGVSMTYSYGFRLPGENLAKVQEDHAARCEALTPARCRITGMAYEVGHRGTISASLQFRVAPELARAFGKEGVALVERAGGMLQQASIESAESGTVIAATDRESAAIGAERQRIEAQLAKSGLPAAERTQLQARLAKLSTESRQTTAVRDQETAKLASTPVTFTYMSGDVDPGLHDGPILGAMKDGWANIISGIAAILTILITLVPWVGTGALGFGLWRFIRTWWRKRHPVAD